MLKLLRLARGVLSVAMTVSGCAHTAVTPTVTPAVTAPPTTSSATPPNGFPEPASACAAQGGKYLGDMKCQHSDGSIGTVLYGAAAQRAMLSSVHVAPQSPRAWALATTAIIFEFNRNRLDMLAGTAITPDLEANGKHLLSDGWGVNNRDDLLKTLTWLQFQGHRNEFEQIGTRADALSAQQLLTVEAAAQSSPQALNKLEIALRSHRTLGKKGILAWDLVRYIAVCRWGYLAGYLSETEAWDHIMPAALRLQRTFASWQDLQSDFLIGREYWSLQETQLKGARFHAIYDRLLEDPSSPWNTNPWAMNLNVATPLPIEPN
jgi:Protein of unknown function (DUF1266)